METPAAPAASDQSKAKTKAKQRYLRRKKDRRKQRKSQKKTEDGGKPEEDDGLDEGSDGSGEEQVSEREDVHKIVVDEPEEAPGLPEKKQKDERKKPKRPKKRQKTAEPEEDVAMADAEEAQPEDAMLVEDPTPEDTLAKTPPPPAALPAFPLPRIPNAPTKADLALLGLDKALVDADIIDPSYVLPIPPGEADPTTHLSERMKKRLADLGITELFAVQTALLPFLLPSNPLDRLLYQPFNPPRDVCVSAPTGSGKTLAYVLPIVELLSSRIVTRLRALIVLPTRDLVTQVRETFEAVGKGRGLKIGTATGQHSFAHEQAQLVGDTTTKLVGGSSKVDILICTPGRLIDHLSGTPNFSLQHLRFLVIDEADRLLAQSFQDWLAQVLAATRPTPKSTANTVPDTHPHPLLDPSISLYPDAVAPAFSYLLPYPDVPDLTAMVTERKESSCQKLLFSATLTRDPGKIAALDLRDPKYFVVQGSNPDSQLPGVLNVVMEKFTMPATLSEHMIICEPSQKPLVFFHLVLSHQVINALVFTKSAESTSRLVKLFEFFERARLAGAASSANQKNGQGEDMDVDTLGPTKQIVVRSYSSDLSASERKSILDKFKAQEIQILVCSDLISRGIDISHVSHVVSYDVPVDMRKYVHRVGRTARAGRHGDAWTLVEEQEARYFKNMLKEAEHIENVKRMRIGEKDVSPLTGFYQTALDDLKDAYTK
ncbi:hypothetical protein AX16_010203 [Volvariella volvacea WC 439]|nr:hypothetical protein AX16_010203 [Volvariella volvacea WC 439]